MAEILPLEQVENFRTEHARKAAAVPGYAGHK